MPLCRVLEITMELLMVLMWLGEPVLSALPSASGFENVASLD